MEVKLRHPSSDAEIWSLMPRLAAEGLRHACDTYYCELVETQRLLEETQETLNRVRAQYDQLTIDFNKEAEIQADAEERLRQITVVLHKHPNDL